MGNNRIYYAVQQVGIRPANSNGGSFSVLHGLQNFGINTNFNITPIQQLGELPTYDIVEENFEIQLNLRKVLDGYFPIYILATSNTNFPTLFNRISTQCDVAASIFPDNLVCAQGTPISIVQCSGLYINSIQYNFDINNNFEESIGFIGNNKVWNNDARIISPDIGVRDSLSFDGEFDNTDNPLAAVGVARRQDMIFGTSVDSTLLPTNIPTDAHVINIKTAININRDIIPEFGKKNPYSRIANIPLETITEITTVSTSGDMVSSTVSGILTPPDALCSDYGNIENQKIRIATCEGTRIYLGDKNKLVSVSYQGNVGGNVLTSFTYKGYSYFTVLHSGETNPIFWSFRDIWLDGSPVGENGMTGVASPIEATGFYFGANQDVEANGDITTLELLLINMNKELETSFDASQQGTAFNWMVRINDASITGLVLETRCSRLDGIDYAVAEVPFAPVFSGGWKNSASATMFLFNVTNEEVGGGLTANSQNTLFPSGIYNDSIYKYRAYGLFLNNIHSLPSTENTIIIT